MHIHLFELRRKIWRHDWSSQLYTQLKQLWNQSLKISGLNGIRTHDRLPLSDTDGSALSTESQIFLVPSSSISLPHYGQLWPVCEKTKLCRIYDTHLGRVKSIKNKIWLLWQGQFNFFPKLPECDSRDPQTENWVWVEAWILSKCLISKMEGSIDRKQRGIPKLRDLLRRQRRESEVSNPKWK